MRAHLSIVIPTLNADAHLAKTILPLMEGLSEGLIAELIISDGGSTDNTLAIADDAGAKVLSGPPSRGAQLSRGADAAQATWILFLHADSRLDRGWAEAVATHIDRNPNAPGYFRLAFDADGAMPSLVAFWANLRARLFALPYGDQGLLIRRNLYQQVGGFPEIPLMEDVAMARKLGRRQRPISTTITTSAERYQKRGWVRQGARNLTTLTLFLLGRAPERLAQRYRSG